MSYRRKTAFLRSRDTVRGKLVHGFGWVRVMVEFGTSYVFRGWVRIRGLGYGFGVRGRKVKSRDCALVFVG